MRTSETVSDTTGNNMFVLRFEYERRKPHTEETEIYVDCCYWLGIMYDFYLKPITLGKIRYIKVTLTEISEDRIEIPVDKYTKEGEVIYIYIHYEHENLLNIPFVEVQKILLDIIHNRLIEYAISNNLDNNIFQEAYNTIIKNNFLFEKKHGNPVSNGIYTAQMSFKFDFQNTGVLSSGIYVEIYKENKLIKKIMFLGNALFISDKSSKNFEKEIEWIDEENIKIYLCELYNEPLYYWKININGTVEYDIVNKDDFKDIFSLGIDYYEGKMITQDKNKGYSLIKKSAEMGYYYAMAWLTKYKPESDPPFFIQPENY